MIKIRWDRKYKELKQFQQENGNCNVTNNRELLRWMSEQRQHFNNTTVHYSPDKISLLQDIGFDFKKKLDRKPWTTMLEELKEYQKENGPTYPDINTKLGRWVIDQRKK